MHLLFCLGDFSQRESHPSLPLYPGLLQLSNKSFFDHTKLLSGVFPSETNLGRSLSTSKWSCCNTREHSLNLIKRSKTFNTKSSADLKLCFKANLKLNGEILTECFPLRSGTKSKIKHKDYKHKIICR